MATPTRCWAYYTNDTTAGGGFALPPIPPSQGVVGRVTLVGAGPGDPELLTLAAAKALGTAELVIADRLIPEEVLRYVFLFLFGCGGWIDVESGGWNGTDGLTDPSLSVMYTYT